MAAADAEAAEAAAGTDFRHRLSRLVGWLSERRIPRPLRAPVFRCYARLYRVDLDELRLGLAEHASLGAFFVRRLVDGARPFPTGDERERVLPSPADGRMQAIGLIEKGSLLQAKGRPYSVAELLSGLSNDVELEGACAWTIYLSPRDYHRVHAPVDARLTAVRWVPGGRLSVDPKVLAKRDRVFATNERAVLRLDTARGPYFLVMVGALNVGRIRVVGVAPGTKVDGGERAFAMGDELARFELGSTVVLIAPPGVGEPEGPSEGAPVRMGEPIGRL